MSGGPRSERSLDSPALPWSNTHTSATPDVTTILFERYEAKISSAKENEMNLLTTISEQREEIVKLQNQLQVSQVEIQSLQDEIDFLRSRNNLIDQKEEIEKSMLGPVHVEAEQLPDVSAVSHREPNQTNIICEDTIITIKVEPKSHAHDEGESSQPPIEEATDEVSKISEDQKDSETAKTGPAPDSMMVTLDENRSSTTNDYHELPIEQAKKETILEEIDESSIFDPEEKNKTDSIYTRIPDGIFSHDLLPFLEHPKELLVLRCINGVHAERFTQHVPAVIQHFDSLNEELRERLHAEMKQDAEMILLKALQALDNLGKDDIVELKGFTKPPAAVKSIMDMVVILLTGSLKPDWMSAKKLLVDPMKFLARLKNYDKDGLTKPLLLACRKIIRLQKLDHAAAAVNTAAESIFTWVHALVCLYHVPEAQLGAQVQKQHDSFNQVLNPLRDMDDEQDPVITAMMAATPQITSPMPEEDFEIETAAPKPRTRGAKAASSLDRNTLKPSRSTGAIRKASPRPAGAARKLSPRPATSATAKTPLKSRPAARHLPAKSLPGSEPRQAATSKSIGATPTAKRALFSKTAGAAGTEASPRAPKREMKTSESLKTVRTPKAGIAGIAPIRRKK